LQPGASEGMTWGVSFHQGMGGERSLGGTTQKACEKGGSTQNAENVKQEDKGSLKSRNKKMKGPCHSKTPDASPSGGKPLYSRKRRSRKKRCRGSLWKRPVLEKGKAVGDKK